MFQEIYGEILKQILALKNKLSILVGQEKQIKLNGSEKKEDS